ncbi:glycosyltransferase family 2 protein, partial [Planktothrix sp. FACHB-1355]
MEDNSLFVSAIIPVYNGEKYLAEAIKNVKNQDYQPLEIIVIDDGSTDRTPEVAAAFKDSIRYVSQPNSGPAAARNHGIRIANGDVIAFLDVDDLWSDDKLKLQANYLANNPSVGIVQGLIQQMK